MILYQCILKELRARFSYQCIPKDLERFAWIEHQGKASRMAKTLGGLCVLFYRSRQVCGKTHLVRLDPALTLSDSVGICDRLRFLRQVRGAGRGLPVQEAAARRRALGSVGATLQRSREMQLAPRLAF